MADEQDRKPADGADAATEPAPAAVPPSVLAQRRGALTFVVVVGIIGVVTYAATARRIDHTAALYDGLPLLLALALASRPSSATLTASAMKWLTILLALAVPILREGYICIILAAPILYAVTAAVAGILDWQARRAAQGGK